MKKQLLAGVLSATMVMASMPTTAMAVTATGEVTNLPLGSTISPEQEVSENENMEQPAEIQEIAETEKTADGVVEVNSADELNDAIDDEQVSTIKVVKSFDIDSTLTLEREVTIVGDSDAKITYTGAEGTNLFVVATDKQIVLRDLSGETLNGRVMALDTQSPHVLMEGCIFYTKDRGISFIQDGIVKDAVLTLDNTKIRCTQTVTDDNYDEDTAIGDYRGISVYDVQDSTITLQNGSELSGFGYCINVTGTKDDKQIVDNSGLNISIENSLLRGWTGFNVWGSFAEYQIIDSTILGINNSNGSSNSFSAITFNGDIYNQFDGMHAYANELYIKDSTVKNYQKNGGASLITEETLLRIDNGITKLTFAGEVTFEDTTGKLNTALDLEAMDETDRAKFVSENIYYEPGATVVCRPEENMVLTVYPVAEVNGDKYFTLADAVNAVTPDGTITILNNVNAAPGISVPSEKNFTIDFDGHTYTLSNPGAGSHGTETNGFQLLQGSNITFKNGIIRISDKNGSAGNGKPIGRIIQNYANLTLKDMQIYAENQAGGEDYALSFNCGNIVFKGDTSIYVTHPENTIVFDICKYSSYPSVTVVFDESYTGTIQGTISYDSSAATTHTLKIKGNGTFGKIEAAHGSADAAKDAITVYSGHYAEPVNPDYLDESLDAKLKSASNTEAPYSYYDTVDEAIQAAEPGDTITVIEDNSLTQSYTVLFDRNDGNAIASVTVPGKTEITLPIPIREGYEFEGWYADDKLVKSPYTVTEDVTLTAHWDRISSGGGAHHPEAGSTSSSSSDRYEITKPSKVENGSIKVSDSKAEKGDTVTITVTPDEGYELDKLAVYDEDGDKIDLKDKGDGKFTFEMPKGDVEIEVSCALIEDETVKANFADVAADAWYADAVQYVYENGMMSGTSETTFSPDLTTTRGMIVTILYRMENEPAVTGTTAFTDVAADQYYANAVAWAAQNGIVSGTTATTFAPNNAITREQMAAILYRYAQFKGYDVSVKADLSVYTDAAQVSTYATDAMAWANGAQLITGTSQAMQTPASNATRAQVATILMRFCENIAK